MLRFFRKMRKALVPENRFGRYFFYAIGEIVLVVIGILIALQVNNWNEQRKRNSIETELLQQFLTDLESDLNNLDYLILTNIKTVQSCDILVNHLRNDLPYNDSLAYHFDAYLDMTPLFFNKTAYENLTTRGPELISDKNLRNDILKLYSTTYEKAITFNNYFKEDYHSFLAQIQLENIEPVEWEVSSVPVNYEALKTNTVFINAILFSKNGHRVNNIEFNHTRDQILSVINQLEK